MRRILHITSTPPIPTWGGAMTFYRHFCERGDFETAVITDQQAASEQAYESLVISPSNAFQRFSRTRLSQWVHSAQHLRGGRSTPKAVEQFARDFQPDAIFSVAGAWSWLARLAERVATRLDVPLVGSFNDWWYYNKIFHPLFRSRLSAQFQDYYHRCDLAICTSEGMQDALGSHPNSVVLYPTGATVNLSGVFDPPDLQAPFTVGFGGNLGDWYGTMIQALVQQLEGQEGFRFAIYGSRPSWSADFDTRAKSAGWFHGQVDFEALTTAMKACDVLLLPMGFDPSIRQIESTSFKTKFLDYLGFEKPIFVWGPEYSSAVQVAREFDSAEVCTTEDSGQAARQLAALQTNPDRQAQLVANAGHMYRDRFHPDRLHEVLVSRIYKLNADAIT